MDIAYINQRLKADAREFIDECELQYNERISLCARRLAGEKKSPVVLLSGPSGSGKTTSSMVLMEKLRTLGIDTHMVSLDNYYLSEAIDGVPLNPWGRPDLESPEILDWSLLEEHFAQLEAGESIDVPYFDFSVHDRDESRRSRIVPRENSLIIFEGIHALNDRITGHHPLAAGVYLCPFESYYWEGRELVAPPGTRILRRMTRDSMFRSTPPLETLGMWEAIGWGEVQYIDPVKDRAGIEVDTSLPYEVGIFGKILGQALASLPKDIGRLEEALLLREGMERFAGLSSELVPTESLLREFIGGNTRSY